MICYAASLKCGIIILIYSIVEIISFEARVKIGKINQFLNKRIKNELDILIQKMKSVNDKKPVLIVIAGPNAPSNAK